MGAPVDDVPAGVAGTSMVSLAPAGVEHMGCSHTRSFLAPGISTVPDKVSPARYLASRKRQRRRPGVWVSERARESVGWKEKNVK